MKSPDRLGDVLIRLWGHLNKQRQRQFLALLSLILLSAFAEVASLGAVLPFLAVLTAPDKVFAYPLVTQVAHSFGISSANEMTLPLTLLFAGAALVAGIMRMLVLWLGLRFGLSTGSDLSIELYRRTLYQPYKVHLARNSSEVIAGITTKVGAVTSGVLQPVLTLISSFVVMVSVIAVLIAVNPYVALTAALGFGSSYAAIAYFVRHKLKVNGKRIAREQTQQVKALQEGLGGIRDVLLDGSQPVYCQIYRDSDLPMRKALADSQFISMSPRYAMETLGIILIAALAYSLNQGSGGFASALPMLGALALGAQRLLPSLQQCFSSWVAIVSSQEALLETLAFLDQPLPPEASAAIPEPLPFKESIRFQQLRFRYSDETPWVLNSLNLTVRKGMRVGLVGITGSGKSTTLDVLMGLLQPSDGFLTVDETRLTGEYLRAWQATIAHVPQSIFLADATLAENIAFGVSKRDIDLARVRRAAQQAQIAAFIESRADGYQGMVGERGVRLSGGQRQRIGIARALYKQASVLIFDEATSALDSATEKSVMESIDALDRTLTIFIIAHRITTVKNCDLIVELEDGRVAASGTYEELIEKSANFRNLSGH
ncbi:MAG: ABC transporter ATP-binding protein [Pseudomonadota bacterium]